MLAKDVMVTKVISLTPDKTLKEAAEIMVSNHFSGVPVIDKDNSLIGIVTQRDILSHGKKPLIMESVNLLEIFLYKRHHEEYDNEIKKALKLKISKIMRKDIVTANEDTPLGEIAHLMIEHDISSIPILKNKTIIGIINRQDIIETMLTIK